MDTKVCNLNNVHSNLTAQTFFCFQYSSGIRGNFHMVASLYKTTTRDFLTPKLISNLFNVFIRQDDLQILHPPDAK
jgi:hypothetical protein